ncbi:hypothetical protein [Nitrosomonas communis]
MTERLPLAQDPGWPQGGSGQEIQSNRSKNARLEKRAVELRKVA